MLAFGHASLFGRFALGQISVGGDTNFSRSPARVELLEQFTAAPDRARLNAVGMFAQQALEASELNLDESGKQEGQGGQTHGKAGGSCRFR